MTEAIEVLQNEIGKIKSHIREMKRMSDVVQCDLVKDWPKKVTVLEVAVERLLKIEEADNSTKSNNEREEICPFCAGTGNENHWVGAGKEKPCNHCDGEGKRSPVS